MSEMLEANAKYWSHGYAADNVEPCIFRAWGRIWAPKFGLTGANGEKVLDYGCGQGANLSFFRKKGFDTYGVDISEVDIEVAKKRLYRTEQNRTEQNRTEQNRTEQNRAAQGYRTGMFAR